MSYFSPNCKIYEFLHIFSFHFVYRLFKNPHFSFCIFLSPFARGLVTPASAKDISSSTYVVVVSLKKERDRELKPANERSMCISSPRCLISAFNIMYISSYDLTAQYMP